jgi:hypothetical protein
VAVAPLSITVRRASGDGTCDGGGKSSSSSRRRGVEPKSGANSAASGPLVSQLVCVKSKRLLRASPLATADAHRVLFICEVVLLPDDDDDDARQSSRAKSSAPADNSCESCHHGNRIGTGDGRGANTNHVWDGRLASLQPVFFECRSSARVWCVAFHLAVVVVAEAGWLGISYRLPDDGVGGGGLW